VAALANSKNESESQAPRSAKKRAKKLGLADAVLTVALCGDEKTAKCASACEMRRSWKHLRDLARQRRKDLGQRVVILRIACPGVCKFGPVAAVFPGGTWYGGCDPETLDRIVECHLPTRAVEASAAKDPLRALRLTN
ncbi:MAG: (2Fe-2S) ferredoxin domain-containing protein, partial [Planctomycetaceae bacterium]